MRINANVVYYLLKREFDDIKGWLPVRSPLVDYPMLYHERAIMDGHVVFMPTGLTSLAEASMRGAVCVCVDDESAKLCRKAGHPTIVVRNVDAPSRLYNFMQALFVRNERLDSQLHAYVDTYAGFQPLLDACAQAMGCSCALVDGRYRLICHAEGSGISRAGGVGQVDDLVDVDLIDMLMASRDYQLMRASHKVFALPDAGNLFMRNVFSHNELVGMLVMTHEGDMYSARFTHFLLDYLVEFVEDAYARIGSFGTSSAEAKQIHEALIHVIAGEAVDFGSLDRMLTAERGGTPGSYVMMRLERSFTYEGAAELDYLARRVELFWPYAHCVVQEEALYALVDWRGTSHATLAAFLQDVATFARETLTKIGVSRPFESSMQVSAARMQAMAALEQGSVVNPTRWVHRFDEHALSWLLAHGRGDAPAGYVMHPAIDTLIRHDERHGTDLVHTLRVFMQCRYNATEAANRLFVARSTLLNRLARIEELTHINLDDLKERLYLGISLEMLAE